MLPFASIQYYKEYLYEGTWPRLNGTPIPSCEPEDSCIMGKKCKHLADSTLQCAYALESILGQVNNITHSHTELSDLKYTVLIFLVENTKKKKPLGNKTCRYL